MRLRCTNCEAAFDGELAGRCPKCLRRTSVVNEPEAGPLARGATPAPWPDGTACPICITSAVTAATFLVELPDGTTQTADTAGKVATTTTVRCRCCDACRERVVSLERQRSVLLPLVVLVMIAWPVACVGDLPGRVLHLAKFEAVLYVSAIAGFVVTVPLVVLDRASRKVRKNLDASWLLRQLRVRVRSRAGASGEPPGEWRVLAEARSGTSVVEATDLLR